MSGGAERLDRIVIVDDDRLIREIARDAIGSRGRVECCESAEAALESLANEPADMVVSDLTMPGISGLALLDRIRREHPETEFVLLTAHASVESVVEALRMGAADYLVKPIQPEELAFVVDRVLSRRRLISENDRLRDALRTVEACRTLLRCLDPGEVFAVALDLLLHALPQRRGLSIFQRTSVPMSDGMVVRGFDEAERPRLRASLVGDKAVALDSVAEITALSDSPLHDALREADVECGSILFVPIRGLETESGVLCLFDDGDPFGPSEIGQAKLIAGHATLALQNAERYQQAKERAFVDDVTEVYNVRFLLQATEREIQRAERYGKELCVLFLDLDRFKLVNDQHGHLVGSQVLRRLSEVLAQCVRQVDTLARYGGDEFTTLLVDTDIDGGLRIAERIRRTVAETVFEGTRGAPIRLTISIGAAAYPLHGTGRDALLEIADQAMYRAKSLGRNCVCSASDLGT